MTILKTNKVIAIGINEYDDLAIHNLNNPIKDIEAIVQILKLKYNFDDFDILSTPDKTTRKYLFNYLQELFINALPDDNILLIFAGHGALNPNTNSTFWKPSDALHSDQSSWFNLADLLSFLNASKANNIAIISDSCFSGGIFESKSRGGGIDPFELRKSREALSSGSKEYVSDGLLNQHSPFTISLLSILTSNTAKYLPFINLANILILNFDQKNKQTPTFGSLYNTGHDGGSLIFELLDNGPIQNLDKIKLLMDNLYLKVDDQFEDSIHFLRTLTQDKIEAVKNQNYQVAAEIRDQEMQKIHKMIELLEENLNVIDYDCIHNQELNNKKDKLRAEQVEHILKIDKYLKSKFNEYAINNKTDIPQDEDVNLEIGIPVIDVLPFDLTERNSPIINRFTDLKLDFYNAYKKGLMNLYLKFAEEFLGIQNEFVVDKYTELVNLIFESYRFQITLGALNVISDIRRDRSILELKFNTIKWLDI